ncbi:hypothetical protein Plhal304r1_c015g0055141 [Plasmopara halstedii]
MRLALSRRPSMRVKKLRFNKVSTASPAIRDPNVWVYLTNCRLSERQVLNSITHDTFGTICRLDKSHVGDASSVTVHRKRPRFFTQLPSAGTALAAVPHTN